MPPQAADYCNHASMAEHLASLGAREPNLVRVRELAQSREKRKVWMVEVGEGSEEDRITRPAMLVVAGIEGNDLVGPFTVVSWIERLAARVSGGPERGRSAEDHDPLRGPLPEPGRNTSTSLPSRRSKRPPTARPTMRTTTGSPTRTAAKTSTATA